MSDANRSEAGGAGRDMPKVAASGVSEGLARLRLSPVDLDELTGLDVTALAMGHATRLSLFQSLRHVLTWGLTLLMGLGVALVLCVPITLVLARGFTGNADTATMLGYLPVGIVGAIALTVVWHGYALYRGRQLTTLDHLLVEVSHYHEMLTAVEVYGELSSAQGRPAQPQLTTIMDALHLTRENLVNGLTTERILRKHQRFMAQKQALFSRMEQNLSSLQSLQVVDAASEYGALLREALEIGVQVQAEVRSLHTDSADSQRSSG